MSYKYSLFVNGKPLGPYERRMIVGMRVKKIVTDDQIVLREDGVEMTVAQLLEDRYEVIKPVYTVAESTLDSAFGAPSSGMWPMFNIRFGGGPMKPGTFGFNGVGQVHYQGDVLKIRGNRRNKNLGMSKQEEILPVKAIHSSTVEDAFVELVLDPSLSFYESNAGSPVRLEFATAQEAHELWELLNMQSGEMPRGLSYAQTISGSLN